MRDAPESPPSWMRSLARLERPAVTALLLLLAAILCGLRLPAAGDRTLAFEAFGFVEGVLALLVLFLFVRQGVIARPLHWLERLTLPYWLAATAMLLRLALPPPGLGYWVGTVLIGAALVGASGGDDRRRTIVTLGIAVALCGMVRFGLIPFVWRNSALPDLGPLDLGGISDWAKGLVTDYEPVRGGNEVLNVMGLSLYALAIHRVWPTCRPGPRAELTSEHRDTLLRLLVESRMKPLETPLEPAFGAESEVGLLRLPAAQEPPSPATPVAPVREPGTPAPGPNEPPPGESPPAGPVRREPPPDPQDPRTDPQAPVKEPPLRKDGRRA